MTGCNRGYNLDGWRGLPPAGAAAGRCGIILGVVVLAVAVGVPVALQLARLDAEPLPLKW